MGASKRARVASVVSTVLACGVACTTSATTTSPVGKPAELRCANAGSAKLGYRAGSVTLGGLTLEGLNSAAPDVPRASDVGLVVAHGSRQRFRKSPAYLVAGAPPVTIELAAPLPGQALAWVPASDWTGGHAPDLRRWLTTKVTFHACSDREAVYFGGLLANSSASCMTLDLRAAGGPTNIRRIRLDGRPC